MGEEIAIMVPTICKDFFILNRANIRIRLILT